MNVFKRTIRECYDKTKIRKHLLSMDKIEIFHVKYKKNARTTSERIIKYTATASKPISA